MLIRILKNPVARKRFSRFKSMRRAYASLWIIGVLYGLSLMAELICNNVPLVVRYGGQFYFPIVSYYSEDVFIGSGKQTRPDYKKLMMSETFHASDENYMVFPPFPYGPFESMDPQTIPVPDEVSLALAPEPVIGTMDVGPDLTINRSRNAEFLAGKGQIGVNGKNLHDFLTLPEELLQSINRRFSNQAAPYGEFIIVDHSGKKVMVSLATFRERSQVPETIRLTFQEITDPGEGQLSIRFNRSLHPVTSKPTLWNQIPEDQARRLLTLIASRFERPVDDYPVTIHNRNYNASFIKEEVRFPYPPVKGHPLGIDGAGRDVLARILYGLRISLSFGLMLVVCSMVIGVMAGAVQGYYAGKLDITAQRMIEIWSALPFLYVMILMGSVYGRSFILLLVCYGIFNWVGISYYIRAEFLNLRKRPFVEAARCMGVPPIKIIYRHILPNALVPVITFFPFSLVGAIGSLAALDYLGFGLPPPTPSWGELLFQAQQYRWAWWLILYPSLALFGVMLLGVFVGEGIRNAYDPKQYQRFQ
ncbi:MAG: ABC transporter permease subunit [Desulfobacteraceae bacterium]|nr:MAG: ABC transporter permease subunit [Desulfobacteraceae bacterium]